MKSKYVYRVGMGEKQKSRGRPRKYGCTAFGRWLEARRQSVIEYSAATGLPVHPLLFYAGLKPTRAIESANLIVSAAISADSGIPEAQLLLEALEARRIEEAKNAAG